MNAVCRVWRSAPGAGGEPAQLGLFEPAPDPLREALRAARAGRA